jgi:hypothetical protein
MQKALRDNGDRLGAGALFGRRGLAVLLARAKLGFWRGKRGFERSKLLLDRADSHIERFEIGNIGRIGR